MITWSGDTDSPSLTTRIVSSVLAISRDTLASNTVENVVSGTLALFAHEASDGALTRTQNEPLCEDSAAPSVISLTW